MKFIVNKKTIRKSIFFFIISLLGLGYSINAAAVSNALFNPPEVTIHFKNDDPSSLLISTMPPYLDKVSHFSILRSQYWANWNLPTGIKSFDDINKIIIDPMQTISASLSYKFSNNFYGMSQYSFNYENRDKEYGCFVTELRLSGRLLNHNIVIASYRYDPNHPTDYLTCEVKQDLPSPTSFTVTMTSAQNLKKELGRKDSERYSIAGDQDKLKNLNRYYIDKPIELWKDEKDKLIFELKDNKMDPTLSPIELASNKNNMSGRDVSTIELVNATSETLVAGEPLLEKFSRLSSRFFINQPQTLQPHSQATANLSMVPSSAVARLNYHLAGYAEDSGCYITTLFSGGGNVRGSLFWTAYYFDPQHPSQENLYCLISSNPDRNTNKITVTIYKGSSFPSYNPNASIYYSPVYGVGGGFSQDAYRQILLLDDAGKDINSHVDQLHQIRRGAYMGFSSGLNFPIDPIHYLNVSPYNQSGG